MHSSDWLQFWGAVGFLTTAVLMGLSHTGYPEALSTHTLAAMMNKEDKLINQIKFDGSYHFQSKTRKENK